MALKRGLGRGLDALIKDVQVSSATLPADTSASVEHSEDVVSISIDSIRPNPCQPRHAFSQESIEELVQSIQTHGVLQPLLLRRVGDGYELVAGERRLRAARHAGLESVPAIVRDVSDEDSLALALIENLQREDLNVIEQAEGYQRLSSQFGLTHDEIAKRVGKARASVTNVLRLLELPEQIKQMIIDGILSAGHAKVLLGVSIDDEKYLLSKRVVKEGLSVRELEKIVAKLGQPPKKPRAFRADIPADHLRYLSDKLHRHFGTGVRIVPSKVLANGKKSKGMIEIDFYSNDDLDRILDVLRLTED